MTHYYIDSESGKDGPHDLVTVMRRIRTHKIHKDTLIYMDDETLPAPAYSIADIALFFETPSADLRLSSHGLTLGILLRHGWQFVQEHTLLAMFSGVVLLLSMLATSVLTDAMGTLSGGIAAWVVFVMLHNLYLVFGLRSTREQPHGAEFIQRHILPIFFPLMIASALLALMIAGGLLLVILPGMYVAVMYVFTPFLMYDRRYGVIEAMMASRMLVQKNGKYFLPLLLPLICMHFICLVLIIPMAVTLPMYVAALSRIYDEIVTV